MNVKRLLLMTIVMLSMFSLSSFAQNKTVTGKVTDSKDGSPLIGATISVKGTKLATQTASDGTFRLNNVPANANSLIISSVGYSPQTLAIGSGQMTVSLLQTNSTLNDVVVIGYGTQRRREVTGAISKVSADQLTVAPVPSFEAALEGKAPGVQVISGNGLAGSGSVIRVRGIGSISASGDPLFVVDGVPIITDPFIRGNSGAMNQNPLSSINPNDIESVEILKDAGATGIYGSRGANGVILITTKRGKSGKPTFTYSNKIGATTYAQKPDFVNGPEWLQLRQEAWVNSGHTGNATLPGTLTWAQASQNNTDWWKQLTHTGLINEHSLSMTQGTKVLKTFANLTYSNDESYMINNALTRMSARLNMDYIPSTTFKVSLTSGYNYSNNKRVDAAWDGGIGDAMSDALPIYPVYNANGTYYTNSFNNPVRQLNEKKWRETDGRFLGGLTLEYQPVKNLFVRATGSWEHINFYDDQFQTYILQQKSVPDSGYAQRDPYWGDNWATTVTANYLWNIKEKHKFNFLLGTEAQEDKLKHYSNNIHDFSSQPYWDHPSDYKTLRDKELADSSIVVQEVPGDTWTFNSVFGRLNYTYLNRYSLQLVARVDGSSKFGTNHKHGFFPAVSAAWTLSEEPFLKGNRYINFLKLRASYGVVGNANIPGGSYYDNYGIGSNNYNGSQTVYLNQPGNPDLKWETLHNIDAALEFTLFNNRLSGEVAYYHKITTDILLQPGVQFSTGYKNVWRNLDNSKILNQGLEISANLKIIDGRDVRWTVGGNIAKNQNKVLQYELGPDAVSGGTNDTRIVVGLPVGVNYLVRFHGVDPADGLPIWLDKNGKETKTFSLDERVYAGSVMPDYIGGFNTTFDFKNLELSTLFTYVIGGNIYENSGKYQFEGVSTKFWNFRTDFLNRWTKPGDVAEYPKVVASVTDYPGVPSEDQFNSTMFLRSASYLKMKELTLAYNFPKSVLGHSFIKSLRIFFTGTNLLTFSKYPGGDPEITRDFENPQDRNLSPNITYLTAPTAKTFIGGINMTF